MITDHDNFVIQRDDPCCPDSAAPSSGNDDELPVAPDARTSLLGNENVREGARWWLVSLPARVTTLIVAVLAVVGGVIFVLAHYLLGGPPTVDFAAASSGQVNVTMQTDASSDPAAVPDHPTWVSYFIKSPASGSWVHTTLFQVPAHTRVNVTIP